MGISFYILLVIFLVGAGKASAELKNCGERNPSSKVKRIIAGKDALPDSWLWVVDILRSDVPGRCCGTLISDEWVVTAAHCVFPDPDPTHYKVVLGQYDRAIKDPNEKEYNVLNIRIHEDYKPLNYSKDIALMKIASTAKRTAKLIPRKVWPSACLPEEGSRVPAGKECFLTGWGTTNASSRDLSQILQEANMPVVDHATCVDKNKELTDLYKNAVDEETMLCAGYGGDSRVTGCNGDGGCPLVCEESGRWVLRGVGSWGDYRCGGGPSFSVFVRVETFVSWIRSEQSKPDFFPEGCKDVRTLCPQWEQDGHCDRKWWKEFMKTYCPRSCGYCSDHD